jgi:hypothetical protein
VLHTAGAVDVQTVELLVVVHAAKACDGTGVKVAGRRAVNAKAGQVERRMHFRCNIPYS